MRKLVAALACRVGGQRLYGKPLQMLDLERQITVLDHMIDWIRTEPVIDDIVLGVADGPENEPFHAVARKRGLPSITGDQIDVLSRLIQCGEAGGATDVFRTTTESPFTYFEAIASAWERHQASRNDVTNLAAVPDGSGFEIITMETLRRSHSEGDSRHRSELCTLYVREHRDEFRVDVIIPPPDVRRPELRLTIDYPEDLVLCRRIAEHFRAIAPRIPLAGIVQFLDERPDLRSLVTPYISTEPWYEPDRPTPASADGSSAGAIHPVGDGA
jgi:spore coat polysaccharide biosynthesis protein SpsF